MALHLLSKHTFPHERGKSALQGPKSCCFRVGPRCHISCANINSQTASNIPWVTEMRYLGGLLCAIQVFEMFVNCRQARFLSGSQQYSW